MGAMRSRLPLAEQRDEVECRRCGVVCQKVIHPQRCMEQGCPFLYAYEAFGHKYAGCLQGVFGVAIDVEHLTRARKRRNGFGAIRAVREPLPMCPAEVERAYEHRAEPLGCINPEFHELPDRPSFRVIENTRPTA
ncbi:MAG TPA: hypothetical protein VFM47_02465 [Gaiellales bacterium]|jgi:hypothetical protein|nr:hypothetical protein [Gaiellales bacterium]